jgi:hypothetical protein
MNNQSPVSIVAPRPVDYLRKHLHVFVRDGAGMLTREETAARKYAIERRCDKMAARLARPTTNLR